MPKEATLYQRGQSAKRQVMVRLNNGNPVAGSQVLQEDRLEETAFARTGTAPDGCVIRLIVATQSEDRSPQGWVAVTKNDVVFSREEVTESQSLRPPSVDLGR
jgi:hypothetical protein